MKKKYLLILISLLLIVFFTNIYFLNLYNYNYHEHLIQNKIISYEYAELIKSGDFSTIFEYLLLSKNSLVTIIPSIFFLFGLTSDLDYGLSVFILIISLAFGLFSLGKNLFNESIGLIAVLLLYTHTIFLSNSFLVFSDLMVTFSFFFLVYFFIMLVKNHSYKMYFLFCLFFILYLYSKATFLIILPFLLIYLVILTRISSFSLSTLIKNNSKLDLIIFFLSLLLISLVTIPIFYHVFIYNLKLVFGGSYYLDIEGFVNMIPKIIDVFFQLITNYFFLLSTLSLIIFIKKSSHNILKSFFLFMYSIWIIIPLIIIIVVPNTLSVEDFFRQSMPYLPFISLLIAWGIYYFIPKEKIIFIAGIILLCIVPFLIMYYYHTPSLYRGVQPVEQSYDYNFILNNITEFGEKNISLTYIPYSDNYYVNPHYSFGQYLNWIYYKHEIPRFNYIYHHTLNNLELDVLSSIYFRYRQLTLWNTDYLVMDNYFGDEFNYSLDIPLDNFSLLYNITYTKYNWKGESSLLPYNSLVYERIKNKNNYSD